MSTFNFRKAVTDYRFLKNRGYPAKAALKLVGDRYRLSLVERNCLLRGVVEDELASNRRMKNHPPEKIAGRAPRDRLFNVLITVESYLKGSPLFLADDGVIRDAAKVHGSYRRSPQTQRAVRIIFDALSELSPNHGRHLHRFTDFALQENTGRA